MSNLRQTISFVLLSDNPQVDLLSNLCMCFYGMIFYFNFFIINAYFCFYYQVLFGRVIAACSVNSKSQNTIFYLLFSLNPSCVFVCLVTFELTAFSSRILIKSERLF